MTTHRTRRLGVQGQAAVNQTSAPGSDRRANVNGIAIALASALKAEVAGSVLSGKRVSSCNITETPEAEPYISHIICKLGRDAYPFVQDVWMDESRV